tara:strand:+ start:1385 stop:1654 length:270 start_codon:yes stop_codon:yes gene_type:complete
MSEDRETIIEMVNRSEKIFNRLELLEKLGILDNFLHSEVFNHLVDREINVEELTESDFAEEVIDYKNKFMMNEDDLLDGEGFYTKYCDE